MFRDLRTQILLWTILPLAILLIGIAYLGVNSHQVAMRDLVDERDSVLARAAAARVSESITDHMAVLRALDAVSPDVWAEERSVFDGGMASLDRQGDLNALPSREVWDTRRTVMTGLYTLHSETAVVLDERGTLEVLIAVPNEGQVLYGAYALPPLEDKGLGVHGMIYLVDAKGIIIAHPDAARMGQNVIQSEGIVQVLHGESGATFHEDSNGNEVVGYAPVAATGWELIVEEPWAEVITPMFQYAILLPLVLLLAAVVALGAVYFGVRNVVRPLQQLAQAANRIAFGDYDAAQKPVGGVSEIEELRVTLDRMASQVEASQKALQGYITRILSGQEDERMRLAHELHDDTIQSLIALRQRVEIAQRALAKDPSAAALKMTELKEMLDGALTAVRRFVRDLRPTYLENFGLIPALELLTKENNANLVMEGIESRLDTGRELALYRIVQEALRNIAKHAHAQKVEVTLAFEADGVTATVADDGSGFAAPANPAAYAQAGHFGLMGMQERAQLFGGNVYIKSEHGRGTKVVAFVPVAAANSNTDESHR